VGEAWKGVGGWFKRVDASMSATDPNRECTVASLTGGSKARRKLAFELSVDPYTTFEPLSGLTPTPSGSTPTGTSATTFALVEIDRRGEAVVLIGDVNRSARGVDVEQLGIWTGRQGADYLVAGEVEDLHRVVVARADEHDLPSLVSMMPRGRWPTGPVSLTSSVAPSITGIELPFSFET
jgi:hypothetical protein